MVLSTHLNRGRGSAPCCAAFFFNPWALLFTVLAGKQAPYAQGRHKTDPGIARSLSN